MTFNESIFGTNDHVKGKTCFLCRTNEANTDTRAGNPICWGCARRVNMCEICGSIQFRNGEQLHYEEECFK